MFIQTSNRTRRLDNEPVQALGAECRALLRATVNRIYKDIQQVARLIKIVFVDCGARRAVDQARFGIGVDMRFYSEMLWLPFWVWCTSEARLPV